VRSQGTGFLLRRAAGPAAFTLLLVPHSGQNGKRWFIPTILMRLAAAMLLVSLVTLTWLVADYLRLQRAAEENQELRALVNEQERQIQALGLQAAVVRERMAELELLDAEVRQMVGLPTAEEERNAASTTVSSRGGPAQRVTLTDIRNTLTLAAMEIEPAKERLEDLKEEVEAEQERLAHIPNGWPVKGRISSRFGVRRSPFGGSSTEFHAGVDIAASYGTAVRATGAARVVFAGIKGGYGRVVILDHGYGYRTVYGHNSKLNVKTGQTVERGDIIAYVGSSGRSTGPHVHYEVLYQGRNKNPSEYMP
jgi:murein DD-endopeptidase MepM/ murein hydrolase activator NlpD